MTVTKKELLEFLKWYDDDIEIGQIKGPFFVPFTGIKYDLPKDSAAFARIVLE